MSIVLYSTPTTTTIMWTNGGTTHTLTQTKETR